MRLTLRFDMRLSVPGVDRAEQYAAMLDICEWADRLGFEEVFFGEHHGAEDGYIPQPVVLASAVAGRTRAMRLHICALLLPMHDPLHLAEQLAVLDLVSNGRVDITAGMGYRPHEFEMFGVDMKRRLPIYLETIETLRKAWTGEPFEYRGKTVRVTPKPVQPGGPPISIGGSTEATALRAARMGFDYWPPHPSLYEVYKAECCRLGRPEPPPRWNIGPFFMHVSEDPERDWKLLGPAVLEGSNTYARWSTERGTGTTMYVGYRDIDHLRASGLYHVVKPEHCLEYARALGPNGSLHFQPLFGGQDPRLAWQSLRLFEREVLPRLREEGLRPA